MYKNITNIIYNYRTNKICIKFFDEKYVAELNYNRSFFVKRGLFAPNAMYDIVETDKKYLFNDDAIDKIIIKNPACLQTFNNYNNSDKENEFNNRTIYQFDLRPESQFLLYEKNIHLSENYNVAYFDIETDDCLDSKNPTKPILEASILYKGQFKVWDIEKFGFTDGKNKHDDYVAERKMLKSIFKYLTQEAFPDVILGWNVINFDREYLLNRAKMLDININKLRFELIQWIDGIEVLRKMFGYGLMTKTGGFGLDNIANHFLGVGKLDLGGTFGKIYRTDKIKAIKYNMIDNKRVMELDEKVAMINFLVKLQKVSKIMLRDAFYNSIVIDHMLLTKYDNLVFPSKTYPDEIEKYEGGYVINPPSGLFSDVTNYDFASMYPSIIMTLNISPDTKVKNNPDFRIDGVGFSLEKDGIFKETIRDLYNSRIQLKHKLNSLENDMLEYKDIDTTQLAYKTILNSFYGVCAFKQFRLYDVDLAKSITSMGRKLIKVLKDKIDSTGYGKVLYGDTDSVFVQRLTDSDKILDYINDNIIPDYLSLYKIDKNEYIKVEINYNFKKIIFIGKKKKYIGLKEDDTLDIKGFSIKKYDTPRIIRDDLEQIVKDLLDEKIIDVNLYRKKLISLPFTELPILKKFNKQPNEYKNKPPHLRGLEWASKYLNILEETKTSKIVNSLFVKIDDTKYDVLFGAKAKLDVIVFDETVKKLPEGVKLNYTKYFMHYYIKSIADLYFIFGKDCVKNLYEFLYTILDLRKPNWYNKNKDNITRDSFYSDRELFDKMIKQVDSVINKEK